MGFFPYSSIRRQLMAMSLLAAGGALLLAASAFMIYDFMTYRDSMVRLMSTLAEIVSVNSASAVVFNDSASAAKTLEALKARPSIISAGIYTSGGERFAVYRRDSQAAYPSAPEPLRAVESYTFRKGELILEHPIILDKAPIGMVVILTDLTAIRTRFMQYAVILGMVLLISLVVAGFISFQVGQTISRPISQLVQAALAVSERKDYTVRAADFGPGPGEVGLLVRTFNEMLLKIQEDGINLRESEQRFRALVTASSDVVYRMNSDWTEMRQLQGRDFIATSEKPNRAWFKEYIPDEEQPRVRKAIQEAIQNKSVFQVEHQVRQVDGSIGWTFSRAVPLLDAQGAIYEWFGAASDVTVRKRAEEQIRQLNENLEQKVTNRTEQLSAANKELEAFSYSVSHDLRAPLRHIGGFSDLLLKNAALQENPSARRYLTMILDSVKQMGALIDDLLGFSRMGRSELMRTRLTLNDIVRSVVDELKAQTEGRAVEWKIGDLPEIQGDPAMIRVVFMNLLSNAFKYSRMRSPAVIEVGVDKSIIEGGAIFVRDNGAGFDMQYADKLFGVFQRLHSSDEFEGTGIGLATVRRIIQRHDGRIWAQAAVNQGATFYVAFSPHHS